MVRRSIESCAYMSSLKWKMIGLQGDHKTVVAVIHKMVICSAQTINPYAAGG